MLSLHGFYPYVVVVVFLINIIHPIANEKTVTTMESSSQEDFIIIIVFSFTGFNMKASKCLKTLTFKSTIFHSSSAQL